MSDDAAARGETNSTVPPTSSTRTASTPPAPTPAASPPRRGRSVTLLSIGLLIVVLALVGTVPFWGPPLLPLLPWSNAVAPRGTGDAPDRAQLQQRLGAIEQKLATLAPLGDRVSALEQRPQNDATAPIAALTDSVQQLAARLDRMDQRMSDLARQQAASAESPERVLMLALTGLGNAVASSGPYAAQLKSVEALAQGRSGWAAALQPLEAGADQGIPSLAVLTQRFDTAVAPAILRSEQQKASADGSLGDAVLARLRSLVTIRRVDEAGAGTSPTDRAVTAAKAALGKGDLAGSVAALDGLSGAPAEAASGWIGEAKRRLAANDVLARLSAELANDLASGASGG